MSCGDYACDEYIIKASREIHITITCERFRSFFNKSLHTITLLLWHLLKSTLL